MSLSNWFLIELIKKIFTIWTSLLYIQCFFLRMDNQTHQILLTKSKTLLFTINMPSIGDVMVGVRCKESVRYLLVAVTISSVHHGRSSWVIGHTFSLEWTKVIIFHTDPNRKGQKNTATYETRHEDKSTTRLFFNNVLKLSWSQDSLYVSDFNL